MKSFNVKNNQIFQNFGLQESRVLCYYHQVTIKQTSYSNVETIKRRCFYYFDILTGSFQCSPEHLKKERTK